MEKIAVFDLLKGRLVAAQRGHRAAYQPISQTYGLPQEDPNHWAQIIRTQLGICRFYIADLDAMGNPEARQGVELARRLLESDSEVWLDMGTVGLDSDKTLSSLLQCKRFHLIAPTEGAGIESVAKSLAGWPSHWRKRVTVSLDLFGPTDLLRWYRTDWLVDEQRVVTELGRLAESGLESVILLNLSDVGSGVNTTVDLLHRMQRALPQLKWIGGGGVSSEAGLKQLEDSGCHSVLLGSWIWRQIAEAEKLDHFAGQGDQ